MKSTKEFQLVDINKLVPYANNARTHSPEQINKLRASLREFGFVSPAVIDRNYNILVGHGRTLAAKAEGYTEIPCVFADEMTEAQKKAYILADNRMALDAGWDEELLAIEMESLQEFGFDLALTGFDEKELAALFDDENAKEDEVDIDAELEKPHFSKEGDLWLLGKHRVLCGDSTLPESYETLLQGEKVNLVVTDIPYFVDYHGRAGTIKNDNLDDEAAYDFTLKALTNIHDHMSKDASIYLFHADTKGLIFRRAFDAAGFYLSSCCIWKKDSLVLGRSPYQWITESILFGWRKDGKHKWYAGRAETNCWEFPKPRKNASHPTEKSIPLMAYPMKNSSAVNEIVLDAFLGSGSSLIACDEIGRICRGIELDTKYMDVIVRRYILHADGKTDEVFCIRGGKKLTLEQVVAQMEEPVGMDTFRKQETA